MPSYDYSCKACSHEFEHLSRSMRDPAPACPKCGGKVEKKLTTVSVGSSSGSDRAAVREALPMRGGGGCGRCGDPQGPCST